MLKAQNISFHYSGKFSLENINLEVQTGEIVAIIGHSGSGKSTLLHILGGLKEPASGEIFLNEEKLLTPSKKLVPGHEDIKLVTQQNTLFPNISVEENIAYELRYYDKDYQTYRVNLLAESLGIAHLLKDKPGQLSGGEIQRVMIARALADEPLVLLLDEPVANLDRIHKKSAIRSIIETVRSENIACIMVTHDIYDAFGVADRLIIVKNGDIQQVGGSEDIYYNPKNKYVAQMTGEINMMDKSVFRPEQAFITSEGPFKGKVLQSVFQGLYFENTLEVEDQKEVVLFSMDRLTENDIVNFDVKSFIHFDED